MKDLKKREQGAVAQTYARFPVSLVSGALARCTDDSGKTYIDFTSGIGVNALGFCDPGWARAVAEQAHTLQHACNLFYTEPMVKLAEALTARTGFKRVFFANSGAEANEGAIKLARKYAFDRRGPGHSTIVTLKNSFHGRTVTTLSATGQDAFHNHFFPFTEGFAYAPTNDLAGTLALLTDEVCALMIELTQGEGGVVPLDVGYVRALADTCAQRDILLIVDEVQTGIGRTGTLFAYEQYGIMPSVVTSAKGLGGGLPIGAVLMGEKVQDTLGTGTHGTTFGGNPVCCAGACAVLDRLDEAFLADVRRKGASVRAFLEALPGVRSVAGMGLMLGIELKKNNAPAVIRLCIERGLLTLSAKHKVRLLPPLNIDDGTLEEGLAILASAIADA
ncbi:acetylornithine/succinylornithine family transaminase [Bacillota bacterium Meth-B3]